MAAPTTVRVEAIGQTQTLVRWNYSGSAAIGIYRSPDGAAYTLIDTVSAATKLFQDTGLASGTKYWYKVSDDVGVTFSAVKTVVTHSCGDDTLSRGFYLPRFKEGESKDLSFHRKLDKAMRDTEDVIKRNVFYQQPCGVCITEGAIVINCQDGCDCYNVEADTDINSITFLNCDGIDPCIHFRVPPGTTVGICGFPQGHEGFSTQFGGDECIQAPIVGGTNGRTATTGKAGGKSKPGSGTGGSGGGKGTACECIPGKSGQLTVRCCTASCSMACTSTKALDILICGGTRPYTISGSSGLEFKKSNGAAVGTTDEIQIGQKITITPPANSGSGVAGTAYVRWLYQCTSCASGTCDVIGTSFHQDFLCSDAQDSANCYTAADGHTHCSPTPPSVGSVTCHGTAGQCLAQCSSCVGGVYGGRIPVVCDDRTAPMIAAGCNPCGVSTQGKTFTVTDAQGVSVVTTLSV